MSAFIESAASRETDPELMEAILFAAGGNEDEAVRIWEDGPLNPGELQCIVERVTRNGLTATTDYCWGAQGSNWESQFAAA